MNTRICHVLLILALFAGRHKTAAQGTAFSYQGRLNSGANPASGIYDLRFAIYAVASGGTPQGSLLTNAATAVNNGLFTVTLNFDSQFPGAARWLEIGVRTNGVSGFSTLSPRQAITPTPYAITAAGLNGLTIQQNLSGAPNLVGGATNNFVAGGVAGATIAGGGAANFLGSGTVYSNSVTGDFGTVGGGRINVASYDATVGGGAQNIAGGSVATVSGGDFNMANAQGATVGGGEFNTASALWATVAGGYNNTASGNYSFAAGRLAQALHASSFVWSDDSGGAFASTAINQFSVRAAGGILLAGDVQLAGGAAYHNLSLSGGNALGYLYGSYPGLGDGIHLSYNYYADAGGAGHASNPGGATSRLTVGYGFVGIYVGAVNTAPLMQRLLANSAGVTVNGTFNNSSDRNAKQDFAPVTASDILDKVLRLPVSEWSYKTDAATRHIGPMGQDFYATFNIGTDEKHIAPIDEGGVALAAIKGLNEKLEIGKQQTETQMERLAAENAGLKARLEKLEQLILTKTGGVK